MRVYKLTDQKMQARGSFQYRLNRKRVAPGVGELCSSGWLHCYSDPLIAVMLNSVHANFQRPRLFEAEASGATKDDRGLKLGVQRLTLRKEVSLPVVTTTQRVRFAVLCALEVNKTPDFVAWADAWLSGKDRSQASASAALARGAAWASAQASAAQAAALAARAAQAARAAYAAYAAAYAAALAAEAAEQTAAPLDFIALAKKAVEVA